MNAGRDADRMEIARGAALRVGVVYDILLGHCAGQDQAGRQYKRYSFHDIYLYDLTFLGDADGTSGIELFHYRSPFIEYIAAAAGGDIQFLVDHDMHIAAATDHHIAYLRHQVISMQVAAARCMYRKAEHRSRKIAVRSTRLGNDQRAGDIRLCPHIAASRQFDRQLAYFDPIFGKDIRSSGSLQDIQVLERDIGLHLVIARAPVFVVPVQEYLQHTVFDLGVDLVSVRGVRRAHRHALFIALAQVKIDPVGDADRVKGFHTAFLGIFIVDDLSALRKGQEAGKYKGCSQQGELVFSWLVHKSVFLKTRANK